ncbi:hypothetical protein KM176_23245 [Pseudooceanicola sp. CBS1P-1]|uniref:hypothetical protein n=1 Tax=Pseudooceanicola TaxID=1679449 RepID=UPI001929149A|nr:MULTISPECIES: hypothetical protein [Pseudooceanicola]MBT9386779.1 hypothetical protein [Pseudooceanicola endophyticus]
MGSEALCVRLSTGEEIMAKDAVIGAIHPHVLGKFIEGLDPDVEARGKAVTLSTQSLFVSHYDLKERTTYRAGTKATAAVMLEYFPYTDLDSMLDDFDQLRRRRIPRRRLLGGGDETHGDPTRAPEGAGIFPSITMVPYDIAGKGPQHWDEIKEDYAAETLRQYDPFISNLTADNIIASSHWSPLDMEWSSPNSFVGGDMHGCAPFLYQTMCHRPASDLGQYTVPGIEGMNLMGPFQHPGCGAFGTGGPPCCACSTTWVSLSKG